MARTEKLDIPVERIVDYMLENECGIRQTALHFGCSKTYIWNKIKDYNGNKTEAYGKQKEANIKRGYSNLKRGNKK